MKNVNEKISQRLQALRKQNGWSLDLAAKHTNVSKAMLGQIERGESSLTIATLWKIVTGFNVSFSSFITDTALTGKIAPKKPSLFPDSDKMQVITVFPFTADTGMELFEITLAAGHEQRSTSHQAGVIEHVIVTKGVVEILTAGKWRSLKSGQSLRFAADKPHGYANRTKKPATFHNIICYPRL